MPADNTWTPTAGDVMGLEAELADFLRTSKTNQLEERLPNYQRQYFGFEQGGGRVIFANFFCDTFGEDWQETPMVVLDGGDCFFRWSTT